VRLWHLVSVFPLCTEFPCASCNPKYDKTHHGSVCFPISRLCIPATGWRPDVLGIANCIDQPRATIWTRSHTRTGFCRLHPLCDRSRCLKFPLKKSGRRRGECCERAFVASGCRSGVEITHSLKLRSRSAAIDQSSLVAIAAFWDLFLYKDDTIREFQHTSNAQANELC
jgi:hypothetical protein